MKVVVLSITVLVIIFLILPPASSQTVPDWIKNTAGWWATDAISEKEFVNAIEFLIKDGIISLEKTECNESIDLNNNNIPDEIENLPNLMGLPLEVIVSSYENTFRDKDWSNCKMPSNLGFYSFFDVVHMPISLRSLFGMVIIIFGIQSLSKKQDR